MHSIQKILLKRLFTQKNQKYSGLTTGYNYEDNVVFHLKRLTGTGLIEKNGDRYKITSQGIKEISKLDLNLLEDIGVKSFFIGFFCESEGKHLIKEHPQAKEKFYNLPSGRPRFGEDINKAIKRIFLENTGISLKTNKFSFLSIHLKTIKTNKGAVIFDDAFTIYKVEIDNNAKEKMKLANQIKWMDIEKISNLSNKWPELDILILNKNTSPYLVYTFTSDYIL